MTENKYELIIIISNQGFVDEIMETAKLNGARGGTVIHGKSTVQEDAVKFFGITVQPEKELIFIVTTNDKKAEIMKAVSNNYGINTEARAICLSVPVSEAVGFNF